jgi:hypothetical protein
MGANSAEDCGINLLENVDEFGIAHISAS